MVEQSMTELRFSIRQLFWGTLWLAVWLACATGLYKFATQPGVIADWQLLLVVMLYLACIGSPFVAIGVMTGRPIIGIVGAILAISYAVHLFMQTSFR